MKKQKFMPLLLDKETVSLLDRSQLFIIKGEKKEQQPMSIVTANCSSGGSVCDCNSTGSTSCTSGGSTCIAQ